jgi:hypothetical protein
MKIRNGFTPTSVNLQGFIPWYYQIKFFLVIGFLLMDVISCKEKSPEPVFSVGTLYGRVNYYQNNPGWTYEGTEIILEGPYGGNVTETDTEGLYVFPNLGNGTYEMSIKRDGYGIYRYFGIQIFGTDSVRGPGPVLPLTFENYPSPRLESQLSDEDAQKIDPPWCIAFLSNLQSDQTVEPYLAMRIFIDDSEEVNFEEFKYSVRSGPYYQSNTAIFYFDYIIDGYMYLEHGKKYYLKGYMYNIDDDGYWDPYLGYTVYPTMNYSEGTNTVSFTVP